MLKKTQIALIAASAIISYFAGSAGNTASWWTDHEPNHVILADVGTLTVDEWWTDHEPNH